MIFLRHLLLEIFGKKFTIIASDQSGNIVKEMPALLTFNTKYSKKVEDPSINIEDADDSDDEIETDEKRKDKREFKYRLTWFTDDLIPYKHYSLTTKEHNKLLSTGELPTAINDKIADYMNTETGTKMKMLKLVPSNVPF